MRAHLTISPTAAHLAARALMRAIDRRELDDARLERDQVGALAAVLDVMGVTPIDEALLKTIETHATVTPLERAAAS